MFDLFVSGKISEFVSGKGRRIRLTDGDVLGLGPGQPFPPVPERMKGRHPKSREAREHFDLGTDDAMDDDRIVLAMFTQEIPSVGEIDDVVRNLPVFEELAVDGRNRTERRHASCYVTVARVLERADLGKAQRLRLGGTNSYGFGPRHKWNYTSIRGPVQDLFDWG